MHPCGQVGVGWGAELGGEEKAGESDQSEPEHPSCFYSCFYLLHHRRYLRNLKPCCDVCFWLQNVFSFSSPRRMGLLARDISVGWCYKGTLALLGNPSAYGNAVCLQTLPSKGKLHFIMSCYLSKLRYKSV